MKSDSFDNCETDSAASDKHAPAQREETRKMFDSNYNTIKPKMKKPPRKSRDEKLVSKTETSCQTESALRNKNSGASQGSLGGGGGKNLGPADRNVTPPSSNITPPSSSSSAPSSLTTKSFKMLRLCKAPTEELGIIISKKRNQNKNTSGFEIAHIDPDGLIHRYINIMSLLISLLFLWN